MLRSLNLKSVYDSSDCDLVADLIVPLLSNSQQYFRGVGYFSSGWLKVASDGIVRLVEAGGRASVIMSPILDERDLQAMTKGEEAKDNPILRKALLDGLGELRVSLKSDTLNCLAWLIADELLDIRFAIPRPGWTGGDYHDKVAVFSDSSGDVVAIHGSYNDSIKGTLNGEAFSVFRSWVSGHESFVEQHQKRLLSLWEGANPKFFSYKIPDAVRNEFIKLRTTLTPPYGTFGTNNPSRKSAITVPAGRVPRPYQCEAIKQWVNNDFCGIFEMATGTGKTITSLLAATELSKREAPIAVVILVPYLHLQEQWADTCKEFGLNPILCGSQNSHWYLQAKSKTRDFNSGALESISIIAVHDTAATDQFGDLIHGIRKGRRLLIADEVHNLGARQLRKSLLSDFECRLGLSATPQRWFDDDGTKLIMDYFRGICFSYPIETAIGKHLVPYSYTPVIVNLLPDEMTEYEVLSQRIGLVVSKEKPTLDDEKRLKMLLIQRSAIISSARSKLLTLVAMLKDRISETAAGRPRIQHTLVYCGPGQHLNVLRDIAGLGIRCHEFVHTVALSERSKLLRQFDNGDIDVLVAVKCLDEGVDIPSTQTAYFLASTSNPREFVQRRGRILRCFPGKERAEVYDFLTFPEKSYWSTKRDIDKGLLQREMPRFAEFSGIAENRFECRKAVWDILDTYEMLNLLDEKPWDIYHRLRSNTELLETSSALV